MSSLPLPGVLSAPALERRPVRVGYREWWSRCNWRIVMYASPEPQGPDRRPARSNPASTCTSTEWGHDRDTPLPTTVGVADRLVGARWHHGAGHRLRGAVGSPWDVGSGRSPRCDPRVGRDSGSRRGGDIRADARAV